MPTSALQHEYYMADLLIQSNVSAVSDSDVGDQYMFITILTDFQYVIDLPLFPTSEWQLMINVFLCLPLALLPLIIPVNAIASNWLFLMMCPTNWICLLTIIFRRFLDVLALSVLISKIVSNNYKVNYNTLKTYYINSCMVNITLTHRYNYFTPRYWTANGALWRMGM